MNSDYKYKCSWAWVFKLNSVLEDHYSLESDDYCTDWNFSRQKVRFSKRIHHPMGSSLRIVEYCPAGNMGPLSPTEVYLVMKPWWKEGHDQRSKLFGTLTEMYKRLHEEPIIRDLVVYIWDINTSQEGKMRNRQELLYP